MSFILIKIVSGYHPAQEMTKTFDDRGGVIGRSEECDWVLFDMTRIVSKQHASIV
jgi:predicted component of type VI protein secretion system